jgi:protein required for attachment to host cells
MSKFSLPHNVWVLVGDGRKALVLRNEGDATFPNLTSQDVFKAGKNPTTAALGSDRPGRTIEHFTGRRSGIEQTDWHDIAEHRFAQHVAYLLDARDAAGDISALIVVAPPRTLAELRQSFSPSLRAKIIGELDKDLTKHPVYEIERLLTHDNRIEQA